MYALWVSTTRGHISILCALQHQHQLGSPPRFTSRLFSQIPANGNSSNYVSGIIQKEASSSCCAFRRGCPPPVKHDKRAMLYPDTAIWAVTLQPAIPHKEYTDTLQAVEHSDMHKMEIMTGTRACGARVEAMTGEISVPKSTCQRSHRRLQMAKITLRAGIDTAPSQ